MVARSLVKRYGTFEAVRGIDFQVSLGECFGFLGPNGAGKTTTMKMISCTSPPTEGTLEVMELPVTRSREIKRRLGVVPQENNLDEEVSVIENLIIYARYFDISPRGRNEPFFPIEKPAPPRPRSPDSSISDRTSSGSNSLRTRSWAP